jgi:hypothetical protein
MMSELRKFTTYLSKKHTKRKDRKLCRLHTKDLWNIKNKHKINEEVEYEC